MENDLEARGKKIGVAPRLVSCGLIDGGRIGLS